MNTSPSTSTPLKANITEEIFMTTKRAAAIKAGEKYYNTGKPCKRGHYSNRFTVDCRCLECNREYSRKERAMIRLIQGQASVR